MQTSFNNYFLMVITLKQRKNVALWDFLFPYTYRNKKEQKKFARFQKIIYHLFTEQYNMDISHQLEKCWAFLLNTIIKLLIGKSN